MFWAVNFRRKKLFNTLLIIPAMECLVSDIPAGDKKNDNLFYGVLYYFFPKI
jgi:hypothetical protein